jgi:hypothetical protein
MSAHRVELIFVIFGRFVSAERVRQPNRRVVNGRYYIGPAAFTSASSCETALVAFHDLMDDAERATTR